MSNGRDDKWFETLQRAGAVMESTAVARTITPVPSGVKYDQGKPDLSLVPTVAMEEMAKAFMFGEKKYGRFNYLQGMDVHRFIAAAMRHLNAYRDGIDMDEDGKEFNIKHLGCALASIAMILDCEKAGTLQDTRRKK